MAVVAAEHFVAPVAGQGNRDVLAREPREQEGWHLRRVGKWLVVDARQIRNDGLCLSGVDVQLGVFSAQMRRHGVGERRFVVRGLGKTEAERAYWTR